MSIVSADVEAGRGDGTRSPRGAEEPAHGVDRHGEVHRSAFGEDPERRARAARRRRGSSVPEPNSVLTRKRSRSMAVPSACRRAVELRRLLRRSPTRRALPPRRASRLGFGNRRQLQVLHLRHGLGVQRDLHLHAAASRFTVEPPRRVQRGVRGRGARRSGATVPCVSRSRSIAARRVPSARPCRRSSRTWPRRGRRPMTASNRSTASRAASSAGAGASRRIGAASARTSAESICSPIFSAGKYVRFPSTTTPMPDAGCHRMCEPNPG